MFVFVGEGSLHGARSEGPSASAEEQVGDIEVHAIDVYAIDVYAIDVYAIDVYAIDVYTGNVKKPERSAFAERQGSRCATHALAGRCQSSIAEGVCRRRPIAAHMSAHMLTHTSAGFGYL